MGKIGQHAAGKFSFPVPDQSNHREITVPVVNFPETPPGNHIRIWQGNTGRQGIHRIRSASKHLPHGMDMLVHGPGRVRTEGLLRSRRFPEMGLHEGFELKIRLLSFFQIKCVEFPPGHIPDQIHKGFGVFKKALHLYVPEELSFVKGCGLADHRFLPAALPEYKGQQAQDKDSLHRVGFIVCLGF